MKTFKDLLVGFLAGVGIGALIEAFISILVGADIVGVPDFVASVNAGHAKIIQCLVYGGFGVVSDLSGIIFKNKSRSIYLNHAIHFLILAIYFVFAGLYLRWFSYNSTIIFAFASFVIIYLLISLGIYIYEKNMIKEINEKL